MWISSSFFLVALIWEAERVVWSLVDEGAVEGWGIIGKGAWIAWTMSEPKNEIIITVMNLK